MKVRTLILLAAVLAFPNCYAIAEESLDWAADKARLEKLDSENLSEEEQCQVTWDILWPQAKKGNLEARTYLMSLLLPWPHGDVITMPDRVNDRSANIKNGVLMALYSLGMKDKDFNPHVLVFLTDEAFRTAFPEVEAKKFRNEEFLKCVAYKGIIDEPLQDCTRSMIEHGLIPTFEKYAAEIDLSITQGKKAICSFDNGPRPEKEEELSPSR